MMYITGQQALNLPCSLETCGDWHTSALQWKKLNMRESNESLFGDYGIEVCDKVPENRGIFYTANTLRALLDLLLEGNFALAQGANNDFICNDKYNKEFMSKVMMLRDQAHWDKIDYFMGREFLFEWNKFKSSYSLED